MYRDHPAVHSVIIVPGHGVGPAVVGRSTAEEVLAQLGSDCQVSRYDRAEEVFQISYDYAGDGDYRPDRPAQATRPATMTFRFGLLESIVIGVYQKGLATEEGIRIGTPRAEVLRVLGPPTRVLAGDGVDTLRYLDRGIELDVSGERDAVTNVTVFRPRG